MHLTENLELLDSSRDRKIPVILYIPQLATKLPIVVISHGYRVKNSEYSFLAEFLVKQGYFVVSIQHELKGDKPLAKKGDIYNLRMPVWQRGRDNILFVLNHLKTSYSNLDYNNITLIGHSNGGDISIFLASEQPNLAKKIISLDNLRMPLPRCDVPKLLTIRATDTKADENVLPTITELQKFNIKLVDLSLGKHNELSDKGPEIVKDQIIELISNFLS